MRRRDAERCSEGAVDGALLGADPLRTLLEDHNVVAGGDREVVLGQVAERGARQDDQRPAVHAKRSNVIMERKAREEDGAEGLFHRVDHPFRRSPRSPRPNRGRG